jgi:hypothetical protein
MIKFLCLLTVVLFLMTAHTPVRAADYKLSWSSLEGGGGKSQGGAYVVIGVIGQPETGVSSGGSYQVDGGIWNWYEDWQIQAFLYLPLIKK